MQAVAPLRGVLEDWRALRALTLYRLVLIGALLGLLESGVSVQVFEQVDAMLFRNVSRGYALASLALLGLLQLRHPSGAAQMALQFAVDAGGVSLLVYATGGVDSGLGILLITPLIMTALVLAPRYALMCAAAATLTMFAEEFVRHLQAPISTADMTSAGVLGLMFFAGTTAAAAVAARARRSEAQAAEADTELANLSRLNENIIGTMQTGVVVLDDAGTVRRANQAARVLLGISDADRQPLWQLSPALNRAWQAWRNARLTDAAAPQEVAGPGHLVIPRFSALGTRASSATLMLLDDAEQLREQARQLKLAALGRLSASIAHEIRNPLAAITQAGQLLAEDPALNTDQRRLLEMMLRHGRRIDRIVGDVLNLARPSPKHVPVIDLAACIEEALDAYREQCRHTQQQIALDAGPVPHRVRFDPAHLQQVLHNLWENAAEHAGPHTLTVRHGTDDSGEDWVDIADDGPGIPASMRERIFEPFVTTSPRGVGLGLYIARELCELNLAQLRYVEQPRGARFRVRFMAGSARPTAN